MAEPCKHCGVVPYLVSEERDCWACGGSGEGEPYEDGCAVCAGLGVLMRDDLVCECSEYDDQPDAEGEAANGL